MNTEHLPNEEFRQKAEIRLLKTCKVTPEGKRFWNLYLQVNNGNPIAIKLAFEDKDFRKKNLLLAVATPCEIKTTTLVRETALTGTSKDF